MEVSSSKYKVINLILLSSIIFNLLLTPALANTVSAVKDVDYNKVEMLEYFEEESPVAYPEEYISQGIGLDKLIDIIIEESELIGVSADLVFSKILQDTKWLTFDGQASIYDYNFGNFQDEEGNHISFDSLAEGVRSYIELEIVESLTEEFEPETEPEEPQKDEKIQIVQKQETESVTVAPQNKALATVKEIPVEVKTLLIDGTGYAGDRHVIRSYGTSTNGVLYQFWVNDLSINRWVMIQDYSKSSAAWIPAKPGNYRYGVHIKDEKSNKRLDTHLYKNITIEDKTAEKPVEVPVELKSLIIDGPAIVNEQHEIKANGTSANGVLYQFWVNDLSVNRWVMIQDYSEKDSVVWTPMSSGNYRYGVHIKDEKSNKRLDTHLYQILYIEELEEIPPPVEEKPEEDIVEEVATEINSLTITGSGNVGGEQVIKSTGTSTNGVLYQFWVNDLSVNRWVMIQDYSEKDSVVWTPINSGNYRYGVHIKDVKSNERLDAHLYNTSTIKMPTIILDAGHGGYDPGAVDNGIQEKDLNLKIALKLGGQLENLGYNVIMTRSNDIFLELAERSSMANEIGADIFVSIHGNSYTSSAAYGLETFHYPGCAPSNELATYIQNHVISSTGARCRGVKSANFHVLRETSMPSALIEVGFLSNPQEATQLTDESYQNKIVSGMTKGIVQYLEKQL